MNFADKLKLAIDRFGYRALKNDEIVQSGDYIEHYDGNIILVDIMIGESVWSAKRYFKEEFRPKAILRKVGK